MNEQIKVRNSAAIDLTWQAVRETLKAACFFAAAAVFGSEVKAGYVAQAFFAIMVAAPALWAVGIGFARTLKWHHEAKVMADALPDDVAKVVK